jgi:hypothetical protein
MHQHEMRLFQKRTLLLPQMLLPPLLLCQLPPLLPLLLPGIEFAGVHDSFWTHAGTVPRMNEVLRRKFLDLHSQGLLEELVDQLQVSNGLQLQQGLVIRVLCQSWIGEI